VKIENFFAELKRRNVYKVAVAYRAYVTLQDFDRALPLIGTRAARARVESLTTAYLRLDPSWDPIRNDPRFEKLCEAPNK
jgi:hypothetical protein